MLCDYGRVAAGTVGQFHFDPGRYLDLMHEELPRYDELQDESARATLGLEIHEALELGTGTGETARRVLELHPAARLVGIDESAEMLAHARRTLPPGRVRELRVARLQDPLPEGPFDLVFSTLAVHHLNAAEKRDLFSRVAGILRPGGCFVLADVVVPERAEDVVTPIDGVYDVPDRLDDQLEWLRATGFEPVVTWSWKDVAVVQAAMVSDSRSRG